MIQALTNKALIRSHWNLIIKSTKS